MAKDRMGLLADISYILGKSKIYIEGVNAGVVGEQAIISLEIKDNEKARKMLEKSGYDVTGEKTIVFKIGKEKNIDELKGKMQNCGARVGALKLISTDNEDSLYLAEVGNTKKAQRVLNEMNVFCYNC
ncbi:hypothetical protein JXB01_00130 [Candidatus Micrarchaeota archaeon]|nr:hypothetical protein [Candidatus Micrarchaeota archaeon]